jgi:subtilisin family serine protease
MDPALQELLEGDKHNEIEVLIKLKNQEIIPDGFRVISQMGQIISARAKRGDLRDIWSNADIESIKAPRYLSIYPKEDILETSSEVAIADQFPESNPGRKANYGLTGKGVFIGIADWGFDFTHPNFLNDDGTTRFLAIWDQGGAYDNKNNYGYGTIYSYEDINEALSSESPFETLGYHPSRGGWFRNGTHGTHVLDIAAGNGVIGVSGIASEAKLIAVHLSTGKIQEQFSLGDSIRVFESISFLNDSAGNNPLVYNFSVGNHGDAHMGRTLLEQAIDFMVNERAGRAFVQSAGNYFEANCHSNGTIMPGGSALLKWQVELSDYTPNELEIFYEPKDVIRVILSHEDSHTFIESIPGENRIIEHNGETIGKLYHRANEPNSGKNHIDIFLYTNALPGLWNVELIGDSIVDGRFFSWIERDSGMRNSQSRFEKSSAETHHTIGTVANGFYNIAVGAYDGTNPERIIAPFSSQGPTVDGRRKPDLVAPGVKIVAAKSASESNVKSLGELSEKSGTSMAAPHVTGALALLFELAPEALTIQETRSILMSSLDHPPEDVDYNDINRYGHGYLNISKMIRQFSENNNLEDHEVFLEEVQDFPPAPKHEQTRSPLIYHLSGNTIREGQKLFIPSKLYTVVKGDTLYSISKKFNGIDIGIIKKINHLISNEIKFGQILVIPQATRTFRSIFKPHQTPRIIRATTGQNKLPAVFPGHAIMSDYESGTILEQSWLRESDLITFKKHKGNNIAVRKGARVKRIKNHKDKRWIQVRGRSFFGGTNVVNGWILRESTDMTLGRFNNLDIKDESHPLNKGGKIIHFGTDKLFAKEKVSRIVLHQTNDTSPKATLRTYIRRALKIPKETIGAHYLISQKGELLITNSLDRVASHVKGYNSTSIGIEHNGLANSIGKPTAKTNVEMQGVREEIDKLEISPKLKQEILELNDRKLYQRMKDNNWQIYSDINGMQKRASYLLVKNLKDEFGLVVADLKPHELMVAKTIGEGENILEFHRAIEKYPTIVRVFSKLFGGVPALKRLVQNEQKTLVAIQVDGSHNENRLLADRSPNALSREQLRIEFYKNFHSRISQMEKRIRSQKP